MNIDALLLIFGGLLTGAIFFGYPIGFVFGQRHVLARNESEPMPVRAARSRLRSGDILNAEVIE